MIADDAYFDMMMDGICMAASRGTINTEEARRLLVSIWMSAEADIRWAKIIERVNE